MWVWPWIKTSIESVGFFYNGMRTLVSKHVYPDMFDDKKVDNIKGLFVVFVSKTDGCIVLNLKNLKPKNLLRFCQSNSKTKTKER